MPTKERKPGHPPSALHFATPSLSQPPREIVLQIPHRLEPDRDAHQTFRDPGARAGFGAYPPVRGGGGMRDGGLGVAQVRRDRDHARRVDHAPCRLAPTFHDERDDCASIRILSVSIPFSSTQALKGERLGPAVRKKETTASITGPLAPRTAPPSTLP